MTGSFMTAEFFREMAPPFTPDVIAAALDHANASPDLEICGAVREGAYQPLTNVHPESQTAFRVSDADRAAIFAADDLEGLVHSHPNGPWRPSEADMRAQIAMGKPWAIIVPGADGGALACAWGGARPPLFDADGSHVQRAFLNGVADCYEIIRDYWREVRGVDLKQYPREWEWWTDTNRFGDLYLDNLEDCGFQVISRDPREFASIAAPGDVYLMSVRARTPNHGGVYLGDGEALEHMFEHLSQVRQIAPLIRHITHWLRYAG